MKELKRKMFAMIICVVLCISFVSLLFSINRYGKQSEDNTTFHTAIVEKIEILDTGSDVYADIYTKEFEYSLHLSPTICENIQLDDIRELNKGDEISFGMSNLYLENTTDGSQFIPINSLKTDSKDILSLEDYNEYTSSSSLIPKFLSLALAVVFFCLSVSILLKVVKFRKSVSKL